MRGMRGEVALVGVGFFDPITGEMCVAGWVG